jgi:LacI family transcriptional regulator
VTDDAYENNDTSATAVLAFNDLMAIGLMEGLDSLGVVVPRDLSVMGIDDITLSRFTRPRLTTVATPAAAAGRAAVDLLLQRAERGENAQLTLPTELVVRESTGPAAARRVAGFEAATGIGAATGPRTMTGVAAATGPRAAATAGLG